MVRTACRRCKPSLQKDAWPPIPRLRAKVANSFTPPAKTTNFPLSSGRPRKPNQLPSATGRFLTARRSADEDLITTSFGRGGEETRTGERGRFLIVADMKSKSISGLEEEILNLGPAYSLMPQIWILISDQSINGVRNALVPKLGKIDTLFIIDAAHNKATWFNFGPETDARIRRVWTASQTEPAARAGAR